MSVELREKNDMECWELKK